MTPESGFRRFRSGAGHATDPSLRVAPQRQGGALPEAAPAPPGMARRMLSVPGPDGLGAMRAPPGEWGDEEMHELSIAAEAYRMCRMRMDDPEHTRLSRVILAVGELSAIEPSQLRFAWNAVVADGPDANAVLEIDWRPARQRCEACGDVPERAPGAWLRLCPRCAQPLFIEGGNELDLVRFVCAPRNGAAVSA